MVHVHQLQLSLSAMDVTVGMSKIHKKISFLAFMKASRLFDEFSLFNVFFDFNWEISCSSSIVDAVADSSEGTQQIFQRCFNVVRRLIWRRDVGQRQINMKQNFVRQRWNLQRWTTPNQRCLFKHSFEQRWTTS